MYIIVPCSSLHNAMATGTYSNALGKLICSVHICLQTPYIHFIWQLMTTFRMRDMVMLECRHVSLSLCSRAVAPDVVCEAIAEVMRRNHWSRAAFIGHSYGTFVLSRMAQLHHDMVESMVRPAAHWCMD